MSTEQLAECHTALQDALLQLSAVSVLTREAATRALLDELGKRLALLDHTVLRMHAARGFNPSADLSALAEQNRIAVEGGLEGALGEYGLRWLFEELRIKISNVGKIA